MDTDLAAVIEDLRAHRERLVRELARVDAALAALTGDGSGPSSAAPSMIDRVAEVFDEYPTRVFTAESVLEALREEGWVSDAADPENAMRTTLSRMNRRGDIVRVDRGMYSKRRVKRLIDPWAPSPPNDDSENERSDAEHNPSTSAKEDDNLL